MTFLTVQRGFLWVQMVIELSCHEILLCSSYQFQQVMLYRSMVYLEHNTEQLIWHFLFQGVRKDRTISQQWYCCFHLLGPLQKIKYQVRSIERVKFSPIIETGFFNADKIIAASLQTCNTCLKTLHTMCSCVMQSHYKNTHWYI